MSRLTWEEKWLLCAVWSAWREIAYVRFRLRILAYLSQ